MKRKGDGFLPKWFERRTCPFCGKKGYYKNYSATSQWGCMYCKKEGGQP